MRSVRHGAVAVTAAAVTALALTACGSGTPANTGTHGSPAPGPSASTGQGVLTPADVTGLVLVRGEEQAGQDAYRVFARRYGQSVFANLGDSQTTQARTVAAMMARFGVADPLDGRPAGSYADPAVRRMYDTMIRDGSVSAAHALDAVEAFERQHVTDLRRIQARTTQPELGQMYANLVRASTSHIDACSEAAGHMGHPGR